MGRIIISIIKCNGFDELIMQNTLRMQNSPFILCAQETWRYNLNEFHAKNKSMFHTVHSSSMDENIRTKGRPFGGLAMFIHDKIRFKPIHQDKNCIAIEVENMNSNFVLANVYFPPYDSKKTEQENFTNLARILGDLTSVLESYSEIILCGDLNYHYADKCHRTVQIEEFLNHL